MTLNPTSCCGLNDIDELNSHRTPENAMMSLCEELYFEDGGDYLDEDKPKLAFILFTELVKHKYAKRFATYISKQKLGTVIHTPSKVNLKSGNKIRAWIWTVDRKALKQWAKEHHVL